MAAKSRNETSDSPAPIRTSRTDSSVSERVNCARTLPISGSGTIRESEASVTIRREGVAGDGNDGRTSDSALEQLRSENSMLALTFISVADQRRKAELRLAPRV